jgi:hypothetical protein
MLMKLLSWMTVTVPYKRSCAVIGNGLKLYGTTTPLHLKVNTIPESISLVGINSTLLSDVAEVLEVRSTTCQSVDGILFES